MGIVLLYSGGLESRVLLQLAFKMKLEPFCVLINYGQRHAEELSYAKFGCEKMGVDYNEITVQWPVNSVLTGDNSTRYEGVSEFYVPSRNLLLVSLAAGIAESKGINTIWIGASYTDRLDQFPDCSQEWIYSLNNTLQKGTSNGIQVRAPLLGLTREMILDWAWHMKINMEEVFSGYGE